MGGREFNERMYLSGVFGDTIERKYWAYSCAVTKIQTDIVIYKRSIKCATTFLLFYFQHGFARLFANPTIMASHAQAAFKHGQSERPAHLRSPASSLRCYRVLQPLSSQNSNSQSVDHNCRKGLEPPDSPRGRVGVGGKPLPFRWMYCKRTTS